MEENWYAVEQQIRARPTEARARARTWTMTQGPTPAARRPHAVGITIIRLGSWVLARAMHLSLGLSRALANVRAVTKVTSREGTPPRCQEETTTRRQPFTPEAWQVDGRR
jgi:hypothetical protein